MTQTEKQKRERIYSIERERQTVTDKQIDRDLEAQRQREIHGGQRESIFSTPISSSILSYLISSLSLSCPIPSASLSCLHILFESMCFRLLCRSILPHVLYLVHVLQSILPHILYLASYPPVYLVPYSLSCPHILLENIFPLDCCCALSYIQKISVQVLMSYDFKPHAF